MTYCKNCDLWVIAVALDDVTVVGVFGPIDIDSQDFQTRLQILQISELTGESRSEVIARAIDECYRRSSAANSAAPGTPSHDEFCNVHVKVVPIPEANTRSARGIPLAWDSGMAEISRFYGIVIRMLREQGGRHHLPHFHASYGEWAATVAIDSVTVLGGRLPVRQRRLVEAWAELHRAELLENWELLNSGQPTFKIEPLS